MSAENLPTSELVERTLRESWGLSDFELDLAIAQAQARRDVHAAHGRAAGAEVWSDLLCRLVDARRLRAEVARDTDAPDLLSRILGGESR